MKRRLILFLALLAALTAMGQDAMEELRQDRRRSASNFLAYPGPTQQKLTPAPKGMKPFYLSHYGRHGSRYMNNRAEYEYALDILSKANELGKLTPLGESAMQRIELMYKEADGQLGALTPLGEQQHRDIARRMYERFPEVFRGKAKVHARSTLVLRCIFSMESALQQLLALNPRLQIDHEARMGDMSFMNQQDKRLILQSQSKESRAVYDAYCQKRKGWARMVGSLFNDTAYVSRYVNGERLHYYLFRIASNIQNTELGRTTDFYDLYTDEELYQNWQLENAFWYLCYGHTPLNGSQTPFIQRNLLRHLIAEADSCIQMERPGASLRFGHETIVLPLVCLLGINGYDQEFTDLDQLETHGWLNYRVYPMACNIQLVFYRRSPKDRDILFKVLLNENEATLPLPSDHAPYYRWADFREHYLKKLSTFKEED